MHAFTRLDFNFSFVEMRLKINIRLGIQMKLLRYNSNREVSGPIILIIGPDTSHCIANDKQLFFKLCDTRIFGGGKKFICSCTFLGSTGFMVFDKKHGPFSHFYGPCLYLYFSLIFHAANKRIFLLHGNSELLDILALVST